MSGNYLPWPQRAPRKYRGISALIVGAAGAVYRLFAPIISRFPGLIALALLFGAILGAAAVGYSLRAYQHVADGSVALSPAMSIEQVDRALISKGIWIPASIVWLFQVSLVRDLIAVLGILTFVSLLAMFCIWWERKVSAKLQSRMGPMRVGGWHGWSQSLADGIKLMAKEDFIPASGDRPLFRLAPYLAFVPALAAFMVLPFGAYWVMRDLDVALLLLLAVLAIEVIGVLVAGWASNNKWSVYGAMREACQVVSYEVPMGVSLLIPVMIVGSLRLSEIAEAQSGGWFRWIAWHSPWSFLAMLTYFIASLASCKRAPFDLPEAESELVAGFHTEYSGFRWCLFFFAEYAAMFIVSALLTILFLGAWDSPWAGLQNALGDALNWPWLAQLDTSHRPLDRLLYGVLFSGPLWFVGKCLLLVFVQMWLRWTLPRLRIDQVLYSCVQVILPLTLVLLLLSAVWEIAVREAQAVQAISEILKYVLAAIGIVAIGFALVTILAGFRQRRELVGPMAVERPLAGS